MKKYYLMSLFLFLIVSCSNDNPTTEIEEEEEIINLAPNDFDIEIDNITHSSVSISWNQATDPENDIVTYSVYLNQVLVIENITELTYQLNELNELTNYSGKVVATDIHNNETERTFSFQTERYYLKFLKKYDYGTDNDGIPYSIIKTIDDNYLIAGYYWPPTGISRLFVQKTDYEGNEIWKKFYDFDGGDTKLIEHDSGFYLLGPRILLNLDYDGNLIWDKEINSANPSDDGLETQSLTVDNQGNIVIVSNRNSSDSDIGYEAVITKLDYSGNFIWEKVYNSSYFNSTFYDIVINSVDEMIIAGSVETSIFVNPVESGYWIVKLNNIGEMIWENIFGFGNHGIPHQIIIKANGNYAFAGYQNVFEISFDGNEINNYPNELTSPFSIAETLDNGLIVTGYVWPPGSDFFELGLFKFDSNGNEEWSHLYQESFTHLSGRSVLVEQDGGYRVAGRLTKNYYYEDEKPSILIYKTDPEGNFE